MWQPFFALADETAEAGGRMFIQVHSRPLNVVLSFETATPFDILPVWSDLRKRPLAAQEAALRNPETRQKLVEAVANGRAVRTRGLAPSRARRIQVAVRHGLCHPTVSFNRRDCR